REELMGDAERRGLTNVTFLPSQPYERMPLLISAADACLASLRKVPLFEGALPSKMYEAMACARPLVLAVDGEARELIERQAGAAVHVEPENARALADTLVRLRERPERVRALGANGRTYVRAHFDRNKLAVALEERIAALLGGAQQTVAAQRPVPVPVTRREE